MSINLKSLIGKLNEFTRKTLESSAGLCLTRTNYDIEVEHYVLKLLDQPDGDFAQIVNRFSIDKSRLTGGADPEPRQTQEGKCAHSDLEPVAGQNADRGLDDRVH